LSSLRNVTIAANSKGGIRKAPSRAVGYDAERQAGPPPPKAQSAHRFRLGEHLTLVAGGNIYPRQAGACEVTALMPYEGHGPLQYRVRSAAEAFERVVAESDLRR
jgi:hypothetical protein